MKAMVIRKMSISEKLSNFLLFYRNTEHSTTGKTTSILFMGRSLGTHLDLLKQDLHRDASKKQSNPFKKLCEPLMWGNLCRPEIISKETRNGSRVRLLAKQVH